MRSGLVPRTGTVRYSEFAHERTAALDGVEWRGRGVAPSRGPPLECHDTVDADAACRSPCVRRAGPPTEPSRTGLHTSLPYRVADRAVSLSREDRGPELLGFVVRTLPGRDAEPRTCLAGVPHPGRGGVRRQRGRRL